VSRELPGRELFFEYDVDWAFAPFWLPCGLRPRRDGVRLGPGGLVATFGFFRLATPLDNLTGAHVTRDYRWWTAIGARRSFADGGLTFGTNRRAGVCVHFGEHVPSPLKRSGHPALTVTVARLDALCEAIAILKSAGSR
jgi:hypothetical protein